MFSTELNVIVLEMVYNQPYIFCLFSDTFPSEGRCISHHCTRYLPERTIDKTREAMRRLSFHLWLLTFQFISSFGDHLCTRSSEGGCFELAKKAFGSPSYLTNRFTSF